jgi:hypothetical protein
MDDTRLYGIYRGVVKDNSGDSGRCKVYIPGVYSEYFEKNLSLLPWAEPAEPLFGGNFTGTGANKETGIASWPKVGAIVFLFFDQGDHNYPVYFAASQGGAGWIAEHNKQYVIKTDNVRIRFDDDPSNSKSTATFDSYNQKGTQASAGLGGKLPATLDIEVTGNVNIKITGNVNMQINGNLIEEINGDIIKTHIGNYYEKHVGDTHIVQEGSKNFQQTGSSMETISKDKIETISGDKIETISGNKNENIKGNDTLIVSERYDETIMNGKSERIIGTCDHTVIGTEANYCAESKSDTVFKDLYTSIKNIHYKNIPKLTVEFKGLF